MVQQEKAIALLKNVRWAVLFLSIGSVLGFVGACYYLHEASVPSATATLIGVPMALVGLALKGAELAPVNLVTEPEAEAVRSQATATQIQILQEVTRFQYGASVHLEPALEKIGLESPETDDHPILARVRETAIDGHYALVLGFVNLEDIPFETWQEKEDKMTRFFGPGIQASVKDLGKSRVEVTLVTTA
jgi:hypothetical protein